MPHLDALKQQRTAQPIAATELAEAYARIRRFTESLAAPLETEDYVIQSMPDASPTRWHLAHTTWFFETFVLIDAAPGYEPFDPAFTELFNSYYNAVGRQFPRDRRGLLSRPTVREVFAYRKHVDDHMSRWLTGDDPGIAPEKLRIIELGLHHEQQHQELILTDIKHVFSCNPLYPVYRPEKGSGVVSTRMGPNAVGSSKRLPTPFSIEWIHHGKGVRRIGCVGDGFSYDNEHPVHDELVHEFDIANRLITNGEYLEFIDSGGYERSDLWLSDGWSIVRDQGWHTPLYWVKHDGTWQEFTLSGLRPLDLTTPVCHVSYYEADAYARFSGVYLPRENAWETAASDVHLKGRFAEDNHFHPRPASIAETGSNAPAQMFGDLWEWTCSPYVAYPGYRPQPGALGEYNGKFMVNQMTLRGGSCATPLTHIRRTYRNFFPPDARWQFTGIRLAR